MIIIVIEGKTKRETTKMRIDTATEKQTNYAEALAKKAYGPVWEAKLYKDLQDESKGQYHNIETASKAAVSKVINYLKWHLKEIGEYQEVVEEEVIEESVNWNACMKNISSAIEQIARKIASASASPAKEYSRQVEIKKHEELKSKRAKMVEELVEKGMKRRDAKNVAYKKINK